MQGMVLIALNSLAFSSADEVLLGLGQLVPVGNVLAEVNLVGCPKDRDALLVHAIQVLLRGLNRKQSERHYSMVAIIT